MRVNLSAVESEGGRSLHYQNRRRGRIGRERLIFSASGGKVKEHEPRVYAVRWLRTVLKAKIGPGNVVKARTGN